MAKQKETEEMFQKQKLEFEKLRSDVQIKLKFLDENRVRQFSQVFCLAISLIVELTYNQILEKNTVKLVITITVIAI